MWREAAVIDVSSELMCSANEGHWPTEKCWWSSRLEALTSLRAARSLWTQLRGWGHISGHLQVIIFHFILRWILWISIRYISLNLKIETVFVLKMKTKFLYPNSYKKIQTICNHVWQTVITIHIIVEYWTCALMNILSNNRICTFQIYCIESLHLKYTISWPLNEIMGSSISEIVFS